MTIIVRSIQSNTNSSRGIISASSNAGKKGITVVIVVVDVVVKVDVSVLQWMKVRWEYAGSCGRW